MAVLGENLEEVTICMMLLDIIIILLGRETCYRNSSTGL